MIREAIVHTQYFHQTIITNNKKLVKGDVDIITTAIRFRPSTHG